MQSDNLNVYSTTMSDIFTVKVRDPCISSVIEVEGIFPDSLTVPFGELSSTLVISTPQSSVSRLTGDQEICGILDYEVLDNTRAVSVSELLKITAAEQVKLEYWSESTEGPLVEIELIIKISIATYASIEPKYVPIRLNYRECVPVDFKTLKLDDVTVKINSGYEKVIKFVFD